MGAEVRERRLLEHDLRLAIARDELRLVYQPQKDIDSESITGFEALLRWKHPTRGEISPAVFIPIAEETGTILEIGDWVLKTACREAATWTQPLTVAVNVSAVQLYNADFRQGIAPDPAARPACRRAAWRSRSPRPRWFATSTAR